MMCSSKMTVQASGTPGTVCGTLIVPVADVLPKFCPPPGVPISRGMFSQTILLFTAPAEMSPPKIG